MIHSDLKEPNIMVKAANYAAPEVVLIDFGVSKAMAAVQNDPGGSPGYVPPETILQRKWFPRGDIFCMGVVMMQMVTDKVPNEKSQKQKGIFLEGSKDVQQIYEKTLHEQPPFHLVPCHMPMLATLCRKTLAKEMEKRLTAPQVLNDPWLQRSLGRDGRARAKTMGPGRHRL